MAWAQIATSAYAPAQQREWMAAAMEWSILTRTRWGATRRWTRKNQPACQNDDFAIFVAPTGKPDAKGTIDAPVGTITQALGLVGGNRNRIFVCEGTYAERVTLKTAVSIFGGLSCGSKPWKPGASAIIGKPQELGYALDVQVVGKFEIADLEFVAAPGTTQSPNSIAAGFVPSTVEFRWRLNGNYAAFSFTSTAAGVSFAS